MLLGRHREPAAEDPDHALAERELAHGGLRAGVGAAGVVAGRADDVPARAFHAALVTTVIGDALLPIP